MQKEQDPYYEMTVTPVSFNTATKKEMWLNLKELTIHYRHLGISG